MAEKVKKEKVRMTPRQKKLFPLIMLGAFFEGFDDGLINIALPYIKKTFELTDQMAGYLLSIIAIGTIVAFLASRLADSIGRRPVFLWCVYGYSICSLATAFAPWLWLFVLLQFTARIFLIGCWSVGYVILCEEFEAKNRGWAVGRFQLVAVFGALLIGILLPFAITDQDTGFGWQFLFAVGALPLIPVFIFRKRLPETEAFLARKKNVEAGIVPEKVSFVEIWKKPHRKYLIVMACVWFFFYFGIKGSLNFFSTRVESELAWMPTDITIAIASATIIGIFLIALNGKLLDVLGRKKAATLIILVGVATSFVTFMADNYYVIIIFNVVSTGCLNSFLMIGSTLTNELFPTQIRSTAMAWANNIFGRIGQVLVPTFIGTLTIWLSLGHAIAIAMLFPLISLFLILTFLPETGKRSLIEDEVEREGAETPLQRAEAAADVDADLLTEGQATGAPNPDEE